MREFALVEEDRKVVAIVLGTRLMTFSAGMSLK